MMTRPGFFSCRGNVYFVITLVAAMILPSSPVTASCTNGTGPDTPSVNIIFNGATPEGAATFTVNYSFPGTNDPGQRILRWLDNGNVIAHLSTDQSGSGSATIGPWSIACRIPGTHTFTAQAWAHCNFEDSPVASSSVGVPVSNTPTISLSASEPDASGLITATLDYTFPNTGHGGYRQIWLDFEGTTYTTGNLQVEGTWIQHFGTTCLPNGVHHLYASVIACPDSPASAMASTSASYTVNHKPAITIGFEEKPEGTYAVGTFNFPQTTDSSQRLVELRRSHSNALIAWIRPDAQSGTWRVLMSCDPGVPVYATAQACSDPPVKSGDVMPPKCELSCKLPQSPAAPSEKVCKKCVGNPVHIVSGSMEADDQDPIPGALAGPLNRTYQSRNPASGVFGAGWITIMDARASAVGGADNREGVFLILEDGRRAMFRRTDGVYLQTYPEDSATGGKLVFDVARDAFVHRDAGSTISRVFRASDGRLTGLVDARGDEVILTYDAGGKATSVADAEGRWAWSVAYGALGLVASITVDGPSGLVWTYSYANGKLVTVTAPDNAVWRTYTYGSAGLEEVRDARGAVIERHEYDVAGRAISSFGSAGELTGIQFNLAGRTEDESITRVVSADGKTTDYYSRFIAGQMRTVEVAGSCNCGSDDSVFAYDAEGHVIREQNNKGWVTVRSFVNGRLATASTFHRPVGCDPQTDTSRCRQTPDSLASVGLEPTAASTTTTFAYTDSNWPERATLITTGSVVSGQQQEQALAFDPLTGAVLTQTSSGFHPVTTAEAQRTTQTILYNGTEGAAFNPCAVNPSGCAFSSSWLGLPQPAGHAKSVNGPRTDVADVSESVYYPIDNAVPASWRGRLAAVKNAAGHIVRQEDYDLFGNARQIVSANGSVTESAYDLLGRSLTTTLKGSPGCDTAADALCATDIVSRRMYDPPAGPLAIQVGPRGEATSYTYDDRGRTLEVVRGGITGSVPTTAAAAIAAATWLEKLETQYSATTGRKTTERTLGKESGSWVLKRTESYAYDINGRLSMVTHADATSMHYAYDAGELQSVRDENHTSPNTFYSYDPAGRIATVRQTLASASGGEIATAYAYDRHGNLTSVTDPNGNLTTYLYDDFGQMIRQVSPVSGQASYAYDAAGQLLSTTDANGATTTRTYDALGRALTSTSARDGDIEAVQWTFDAGTFGVGRISSMTDPAGSTNYSYDRRGLLLREIRAIGPVTYTTSYGYDVSGNRTRLTYPGGRAVVTTFDHAGRPFSAMTGTTAIVTSATYLPFGPPIEIAYGNGTTRTISYDQRYRPLVNELTTQNGTLARYAYGYDAVGNVLTLHDESDHSYDRNFNYDDLNRLIGAGSGTALWSNGAFSYDAMGNMTASTLGARTQVFSYLTTTPKLASVIEDGTPRAVTYDAAGNELSAGVLPNTYSPRNLLESVGPLSYGFDGRGLRTVAMVTPTEILSLTLALESTQGGVEVAGEIVLSQPAPAGGVVVQLVSDSVAASVPGSVEIPAEASSVEFDVEVGQVEANTLATITASLDSSSQSDTLLIQPNAALATLSFAPNELAPGASTTGTVALDAPAPAGGALIALSADHPSLLTVPASITIPAAETEETFTATSQGPVASVTPVVVTAAYHDAAQEAGLELLPPQVLSVSLTPSEVEGGQDVEAEVTLSGPAAAGTNVTFESTNESAEAPEPVTIAAGSSTGQATIRTGLVVAEQTAVITALLEPTSATASLTIEPLAVTLGSIGVQPDAVVGSKATVLTVTLTAAAPQQGVAVELVGGSGSPLEHVPFVTVPAGQSQVSVPVGTALEPEGASATIHARHGLTERNATLAIQQPLGKYVSAFTLATTRAVGGDLVTATLELSEPASFGTLVTLASSAPSVAIVPTKAAFPINTTTKTFIVDTEAVTEPVDVTITATYSGAVSRVRLTVVPASQTVTLEGVTIASEVTGGNDATGTVTLSGPAPAGGASVVLSGSRSGVATVPASVTVLQGATSANFVVETMSTNYPRGVLLTASYNHLVRTGVLVVNGSDQLRSVETQAARDAEVRSAPRATGTPRPAFRSEATRNTFRSPTVTSEEPQRRFYFYTPELNLLAETELTADGTPTMQYEYIWLGGQPVAQIATATGEIAWYFNDHLGSPVLQTDAAAEVIWRIEREPFGKMFELRAGEDRRQPFAFPGQEEDGDETSYNIFRWYRAGWGRYTQADPIGLQSGDLNVYRYAHSNALSFIDPLGLKVRVCCRPSFAGFDHCYIEEQRNGNRRTWGLHNQNESDVFLLALTNPSPMSVHKVNDPSDTGGRCETWRWDCNGDIGKCVQKSFEKYPVEKYSELAAPMQLGSERNSNTFVKCLAQSCGFSAGPQVTGKAPGYHQPCPPGF